MVKYLGCLFLVIGSIWAYQPKKQAAEKTTALEEKTKQIDTLPQKTDRFDTLPQNFSVKLLKPGWFSYTELYVSDKECYLEEAEMNSKDEEIIRKVNFTLTSAQLLAIYQFLRKNNFEDLNVHNDVLFFRPTFSIEMKYDRKTIKKVNERQVKDQEAKKAFHKIFSDLEGIIYPNLKTQLIPIKVTLGESMTSNNYSVTLLLIDHTFSYHYSAKDSWPKSFIEYFLAGENLFEISVSVPTQNDAKRTTTISEELFIDVNNTHQEIILELVGGKIIAQVK